MYLMKMAGEMIFPIQALVNPLKKIHHRLE